MKTHTIAAALILVFSLVLFGCDGDGCDEGDTLECDCGLDFVGEQVCGEEGAFGECECDPCVEFAVTMCTCDGVDEFYEQLDTTCLESNEAVIGAGVGSLCSAALDAWAMLGGCEQFQALGDDDTV